MTRIPRESLSPDTIKVIVRVLTNSLVDLHAPVDNRRHCGFHAREAIQTVINACTKDSTS